MQAITLVIPSSKGHTTYLTLVNLSLSNTWIPNISHRSPFPLIQHLSFQALSSTLYGVSIVSMMQQLHVEEEILELEIIL